MIFAISFFISADVLNFEVKFTTKAWNNALQNKNSPSYTELEDKVKNDVSSSLRRRRNLTV